MNKNIRRVISLIGILSFLVSTIHTQTLDPIPVKKLQKDFDDLVFYLEAHPAPYRHLTKSEYKKLIKSKRDQIKQPMTVVDFYKLVSPIYTALKDGHSRMYFLGDWIEHYRKKNGVFPFKMHLNDQNELFVIANYGNDETIKLGTKITAINGVPIPEYLERISPYISYEQENFRNFQIEEQFDFYLMLEFGQVQIIDLEYMEQETKKHKVDYIAFKEWKNERKEWEILKNEKINLNQPFEYEKLKEGIGLIKIYSFHVVNNRGYEVFMRNTFKKIQKDSIHSLVIDVRGNTGGYPRIVSDLLHHVSDKYFKTMAYSEMKVSKPYRRYLQDRMGGFNPYQAAFYRDRFSIDLNSLFGYKDGSIIKNEDFYNEEPIDKVNEFKGDLYLLTDKRSYSASSSLAATFRCYGLGLIIGEETGGTKIFHANSMSEQLPHTDLICSMATIRDYTTCFYEADEGIVPDIVVKVTPQHLISNQDFVVNYTIRIIKQARKLRLEAAMSERNIKN